MTASTTRADGPHPGEPDLGRVSRLPVGDAELYLCRLLSEADAAALTDTVLRPPAVLRDTCWHGGDDLTTIGAPLYRSRDDVDRYRDRARATNHLLHTAYADLHERVAGLLERRYGWPVAYVEDLAIPGFHLFRYHSPGRHEGGGWHFDQLAWQVPYFAERPSLVRHIVNFTLPLAVPSGGTGMDVTDTAPDGAGTGSRTHVPYRPGVLLFNDRELRHRIAGSTTRRPGEIRLTFQGHGVVLDGRLLLFW